MKVSFSGLSLSAALFRFCAQVLQNRDLDLVFCLCQNVSLFHFSALALRTSWLPFFADPSRTVFLFRFGVPIPQIRSRRPSFDLHRIFDLSHFYDQGMELQDSVLGFRLIPFHHPLPDRSPAQTCVHPFLAQEYLVLETVCH
jgi:hypothetical protein